MNNALVLLLGLLIVTLMVIFPSSKVPERHPSSTKRCRSLPTVVVGYGVAVHNVGDELYLCFQQSGAQGMTEVVCTPMKDCAP